MEYLRRAVIIATVFFSNICPVSVFAEKPAGTVIYFKNGNDIYVLLGEHANSTRGWSAFGGGDLDGETYIRTAARKTHEETRGYFSTKQILEKITNQKPIMDGNYATYFVEVSFVPIPAIQNKVLTEEQPKDAYAERSNFAWVPLSEIEVYYSNNIDLNSKYSINPAYLPTSSMTSNLWPIWLKNMRKAFVAGTLPWQRE